MNDIMVSKQVNFGILHYDGLEGLIKIHNESNTYINSFVVLCN